MVIKPAPEYVREIAHSLIQAYHAMLDGVQIRYMFRSKAQCRGGAPVLGTARVIKGLAAVLATDPDELRTARIAIGPDYMPQFFVIELAEDEWRKLDEGGRRALLDHLLCRCSVDPESGNLGIVGYDIQEFAAIMERHGLWNADLKRFGAAAKSALQGELSI